MRQFFLFIFFIFYLNQLPSLGQSALIDISEQDEEGTLIPIIDADLDTCFGYIHVFKVKDLTFFDIEYKFIIYNSDLELLLNGSFTENNQYLKTNIDHKWVRANIKNNHVYLYKNYYQKGNKFIFNSIKIINLVTGPLEGQGCVHKDQYFFDYKILKEKSKKEDFIQIQILQQGSITIGYSLNKKINQYEHKLSMFDELYRFKWSHIIEKSKNEEIPEYTWKIIARSEDENSITMVLEKYSIFGHFIKNKIIKISNETGVIHYEYTLNNVPKNFKHKDFSYFLKNGEVNIISTFCKRSQFGNKSVGLSYIKLGENGQEIVNRRVKWSEFLDEIAIDSNGLIKDKGYLFYVDFKLKSNSEPCLVFRTIKNSTFFKKGFIIDYYLFRFDSTLHLLNIQHIPTKKNRLNIYVGFYEDQIKNQLQIFYKENHIGTDKWETKDIWLNQVNFKNNVAFYQRSFLKFVKNKHHLLIDFKTNKLLTVEKFKKNKELKLSLEPLSNYFVE